MEMMIVIGVGILAALLATIRHKRLGPNKNLGPVRSGARVWRPIEQEPICRNFGPLGLDMYGADNYLGNRFQTTQYLTLVLLPVFPLARYEVERRLDGKLDVFRVGPTTWTDWLRPLTWWSFASFVVTVGTWLADGGGLRHLWELLRR